MIFLNKYLFPIFIFTLSSFAYGDTQGLKKTSSLAHSLNKANGEYQGEIRLQTPDGLINQIVVPYARLFLEQAGDELRLTSPEDLLGKGCHSKLSSVREVIQYPPNQSEVLKAVFDFDPGSCSDQSKSNTLLVQIRRDRSRTDGSLILETLLVLNPTSPEIQNQIKQNKLIHRYFIKSS